MNNYEDWKNWDSSEFAKLSTKDNHYFNYITKPYNLCSKSDILEIGFGNGSFLKFANNIGCNIFGVEIIDELLFRAKENGFNVFSDLSEISSKQKFDMVVMFDVLEHIPQDDIMDFLKRIHYLLKDKGVLLLRMPNGSSPFGLTNQYGDVTHCTVITPPKLDYWSQNLGFKILKVGGDPYLINEGKILKIPSRILRKMVYLFIERLARWVFSPQSKGFLSSNLFAVLRKD